MNLFIIDLTFYSADYKVRKANKLSNDHKNKHTKNTENS